MAEFKRQSSAVPNQPVVLVVDDEPLVIDVTRIALTKAGFFVLTACDGKKAVDVSRGFPQTIHVLISDIMMPNLDGAALAAEILQERPGIKVLLMSGYGVAPTGRAFLPKPFQTDELTHRVQNLLATASAAG